MLIGDILEAHDWYRGRTNIPKNLGDGYLYTRNPIFSEVRDRVLELGGKFSTRAFPAYSASPYTALATILRTSCIPYVDNRSALGYIHDQCPSMTIEEVPDLRRNHVFHEGAHLVAYHMLDQHRFDTSATRGKRQFVLAALMGEAFAFTCETIATYFVESDLDCVFYRYNAVSYSPDAARLRSDLARSFDLLGFGTSCRLIILAFLCSNFLFEKLTARQFATLLATADSTPRSTLSKKDVRFLNDFVNSNCFVIDLTFRTVFTQTHFKLLGLTDPIGKLIHFDFLSVLKRTQTLRCGFDRLVSILHDSCT